MNLLINVRIIKINPKQHENSNIDCPQCYTSRSRIAILKYIFQPTTQTIYKINIGSCFLSCKLLSQSIEIQFQWKILLNLKHFAYIRYIIPSTYRMCRIWSWLNKFYIFFHSIQNLNCFQKCLDNISFKKFEKNNFLLKNKDQII